MRRWTIAGGATVGILAIAGPAAAAEYCVEQAAAPGGDGSSSAPFQTVNEAKAALPTGDTVCMMGTVVRR